MNTYPPVPAKSPHQMGARVQLHGYPGCPAGPWRTGLVGTVVGGFGTNALHLETDDGVHAVVNWSELTVEGVREQSVVQCACCQTVAS